VERLNAEITRAMQSPEAKRHLDAMAAVALPPMTAEQFAAHQQRSRERFGAVIRAANIKLNWTYRDKGASPPRRPPRVIGMCASPSHAASLQPSGRRRRDLLQYAGIH
jgi:hypothetical protein